MVLLPLGERIWVGTHDCCRNRHASHAVGTAPSQETVTPGNDVMVDLTFVVRINGEPSEAVEMECVTEQQAVEDAKSILQARSAIYSPTPRRPDAGTSFDWRRTRLPERAGQRGLDR